MRYFGLKEGKEFISTTKTKDVDRNGRILELRKSYMDNQITELRYLNLIATQFDFDKHVSKKRSELLKNNTPILPLPLLRPIDIEVEVIYSQFLAKSNFSIKIEKIDIITLKPKTWLNDKVVDYFLQILTNNSNCFAFSACFYASLKGFGLKYAPNWYSGVQLFSFSKIFIPICEHSHWFLAVIDIQNKTITTYDSMLIGRKDIQAIIWNYLSCISYLRNQPLTNISEWTLSDAVNIPTQSIKNQWDCGVFLCRYVEHLTAAKGMDFDEFTMNDYRKIVLSIVKIS